MGFLSDFFEDVKYKCIGIGYAVNGMHESTKQFNADMKNITKEFISDVAPPIGKVVNAADNAISTIKNHKDATSVKAIKYLLNDETPSRGDHVAVLGPGYSHHGICINEDTIIHYAPIDGDIKIHKCTLSEFSNGQNVCIIKDYTLYTPDEIVVRAYSRLGEKKYNLVTNNCEHFAVWCRSGSKNFVE